MQYSLALVLFLIALTSLSDTACQLILKSSINRLGISLSGNLFGIIKFIFKLIMVPRVWLGFTFSLLSLTLWLLVLSKADLNFAFSADSMHYIFIALTAKFILKEKVGISRWVGTAFIVLGIVIVSIG